MRKLERRRLEGLGLATVFAGLLLLTAAFAVGVAAPHDGGTVAGPFLVAAR